MYKAYENESYAHTPSKKMNLKNNYRRHFVTTFYLLVVFLLSSILSACSKNNHGLDPKSPITLTMWHNFGGEMQQQMDYLIDEFNSTIGKEQGIIINVTLISSTADLQENFNQILGDEPGAPEMPDITTCYPQTAVLFQEKDMITNLDHYFNAKELSSYIPEFIDEGRFSDNGLYVFPFAKSTEVIYLNHTLFDEFSSDTGITMDCFNTFEGLTDAAMRYYDWTDAKTPQIEGDGKAFFSADSWINLFQAGMIQLGSSLFSEETINDADPNFLHIWDTIHSVASHGGFAFYDGYSSDLSKTGDLICSSGSSAGVLFYGDTITYDDNQVRSVEYNILPFPCFENGSKAAIQRGSGLCIKKTNETREYAASVFLKWFTDSVQNMRFVSSTGYLPVTKEAFTNELPKSIEQMTDVKIKKMLETELDMYHNYKFFTAPVFDSYDSLSKRFESNIKSILSNQSQESLGEDTKLDPLSALQEFLKIMGE